MSLVNLETSLRRILENLGKTEPPGGLEILSYKRNRGLTIFRFSQDSYQVREHGYREEEWLVSEKELPRLLKTIIKREFPRSRKVRVYNLSGPGEIEQARKKL